jgi:hypothetical protein
MAKQTFVVTLFFPDGTAKDFHIKTYGFSGKSGALNFTEVTTEKSHVTTLPYWIRPRY